MRPRSRTIAEPGHGKDALQWQKLRLIVTVAREVWGEV
jgi:hypothetical protein